MRLKSFGAVTLIVLLARASFGQESENSLRFSDEQISNASGAVDRVIAAGLAQAGLKTNDTASDEVFVRRIYLDAIGRIPSAEEAASFLGSDAPDRRARLIDQLMLSDGYRSHQFNWLADMVRHKSILKRSQFHHYERWIKDQIAANLPWDELVYQLLTAEGSLASTAPSGYLLRDPGMPLDSLSNTLTIFLGANVSCAQCHDHPFADWTQKEFYQMAAFFGATDVSDRDPRKVGNKLKKGGISKQDIIAVVAPNLARVETMDEQKLVFPEDYAYRDAKPGAKVKPELVAWDRADLQSEAYNVDTKKPEGLRDSFASWLAHPKNPRFATAVANRLWKRAFGLAALEPVEDLDDLSRAANPALLEVLTTIMVKADFDLREYQRVVFNTKAYQAEANVMPPQQDIEKYHFSGPVLRRMTAEQAWDSTLVLVEGPAVDRYLLDRSGRVTQYRLPDDSLADELVFAKAKEMKDSKGLRNRSRLTAVDYAGDAPNSAEGYTLARASELRQPEQESHFLRVFGQSSRDLVDDGSREGNIPQTLVLMNGDIQELITSRKARVLRNASARKSAKEQVESLYEDFFSRPPSSKESSRIVQALKDGMSLDELVWVLFNTPEFLFVQ